MQDLERAITEWRRQMVEAGLTSESVQELEAHLRDDVEDGLRLGVGWEAAFDAASRRLGNADVLKLGFAEDVRQRRKVCVRRAVVAAAGGLALGTAFCYLVVLPLALNASLAYARWLGFVAVRWDTHEYWVFALRLVLGGGLCFEIPVVILTLVKLGLIDCRFLSRARKYVILVNLLLGALFTTPEVVTQLVLFVPLQALFELSVGVARLWQSRERTRLLG